MLEHLRIPHYAEKKHPRENVLGAGNQQERLSGNVQNPQRLYAGLGSFRSEMR
jgi:hypothetical protein